jgi:hypothetical protein
MTRQLRERGVKIFFEKENIDSLDPKCDLTLNIYASLAEEESRSISTNIRWSVEKRFKNGQVIMNFNCLLGYTKDKVTKEIVIVPDEAEVVREIYVGFLTGRSYKEITDSLMEKGVKTPGGKTFWRKSTIQSILTQEKYIGDAILQKTYKRDFLAPTRVKNTGQAPQRYVENNHPAIIDRQTFAAVQAEIERRNTLRTVSETGKARYSGKYAFSGKIVCGLCGAGYRRHIYLNDKTKEFVWTCKTHMKNGSDCRQMPIKESVLEDAFVGALNGVLADKERLLQLLEEEVVNATEGAESPTKARCGAIEAEIDSLQKELLELAKRKVRLSILEKDYLRQTREITDRMDALFSEGESLSCHIAAGALEKSQRDRLHQFLLAERQSTAFDKEIFIRLVDKVRIKSRSDITFIFKNGSEVKAK